MDLIPKNEVKDENDLSYDINNSPTFTEVKGQFSIHTQVTQEEYPIFKHEVQIKSETLDIDIKVKDEANFCDVKKEQFLTEELDLKDETYPETSTVDDASLQLNEYRCDVCDYKATGKVKLHWHKCIHSNETVFSCNECEYKTTKEGYFHRHIIIHSRENPFKCKICGYSAAQIYAYKRHMIIHTNEKPFKCALCDYRSSQKHHMQRHMLIHTGEKPYECTQCDYKTAYKHAIASHKKTRHVQKYFKCNKCSFRTTVKLNFQMHTHPAKQLDNSLNAAVENIVQKSKKKSPIREKSFRCNKCDYRTIVERNFKMHLPTHDEEPFRCLVNKTKCVEENQVKCKICNYSTTSSHNLKQHMVNHTQENFLKYKNYTREKLLKCMKCEYRTSIKRNFQMHLLAHSGEQINSFSVAVASTSKSNSIQSRNTQKHEENHREKPLKYSVAVASSSKSNSIQSTNTQKREKNQHKETRFKCENCEYKSAYLYRFQRHLLIHTREWPFKCKLCQYKARQKHHLQRHIMIHSKDKPFKCTECDYQTSYKHNMVIHKKNHLAGKIFHCNKCSYKTKVKLNFEMHTHNVEQLKPVDQRASLNKCMRNVQKSKKKPTGTRKEVYKCTECNYKTRVKHLFEMHVPTHVEEIVTSNLNVPHIIEQNIQQCKLSSEEKNFKRKKCNSQTVECNPAMNEHSLEQLNSSATVILGGTAPTPIFQTTNMNTYNNVAASQSVTIASPGVNLNSGFLYVVNPLQTLNQNYYYQIQNVNSVTNFMNYFQQ